MTEFRPTFAIAAVLAVAAVFASEALNRALAARRSH